MNSTHRNHYSFLNGTQSISHDLSVFCFYVLHNFVSWIEDMNLMQGDFYWTAQIPINTMQQYTFKKWYPWFLHLCTAAFPTEKNLTWIKQWWIFKAAKLLMLELIATSTCEFHFKVDFFLRFCVKKLLKQQWNLIRNYISAVNHLVKRWKTHLFFQSQSFVQDHSRHNKPALWLENHIHFISPCCCNCTVTNKSCFLLHL